MSKLIQKLPSKLVSGVVKGEEIVIFSSIMFICVGIVVEVILRYCTNLNLFGMEEMVIIAIAWFKMPSIAYAIHHRIYVRVDLFSEIFKGKRANAIIDLVTLVFGMFSIGILAYLGIKYAIWSAQSHLLTTAFMISTNVQFLAFPVGMSLALLHILLQIKKPLEVIFKSS